MPLQTILEKHPLPTIEQLKGQPIALCFRDGTDLKLDDLGYCQEPCPIALDDESEDDDAPSEELHLRSTLVVSEDGIPLGIFNPKGYASVLGKTDQRHDCPLLDENNKTQDWIEAIKDCQQIARQIPGTPVVFLTDLEGDGWAGFAQQQTDPCLDLLVRAKWVRTAEQGNQLFSTLRAQSVKAELTLSVPGRGKSAKSNRSQENPDPPTQEAMVQLRFCSFKLPPPKGSKHEGQPPIDLSAIHVIEPQKPSVGKPLEVLLLTTRRITTVEGALQCLQWYDQRSCMALVHRVLRSSSRNHNVMDSADCVMHTIAMQLCLVWRVLLLTIMASKNPDMPADKFFSKTELEVLSALDKERRSKINPAKSKKKIDPPSGPLTLGWARGLVAALGGYLDRTSDPPPDHKVLGQGFLSFESICEGYRLRISSAFM